MQQNYSKHSSFLKVRTVALTRERMKPCMSSSREHMYILLARHMYVLLVRTHVCPPRENTCMSSSREHMYVLLAREHMFCHIDNSFANQFAINNDFIAML